MFASNSMEIIEKSNRGLLNRKKFEVSIKEMENDRF